MKIVTTLTNEQLQLFHAYATVIRDDNSGENYYFLPYIFKDLGYNEFEVIEGNNLPNHVKGFIQSEIEPIT